MEWQVGAYMLLKTQSKINNKPILQYPIWSPPSSHNVIVETSATKHIIIPTTPLLNKKKTIIPLRFQLPNGTVLKSTNEVDIQLAAIIKESTKPHLFPHITSGALILVSQLCNHGCIYTFTNKNVTIYKKNGTSNKNTTILLNYTMDNRY